jgi:predicted PhzF superfamily epimerase YddE/YHI9
MKYYIVDAFADHVFQGNQAGVCLVDRPLDDETTQRIASENSLAETAFVMPKGNEFVLR